MFSDSELRVNTPRQRVRVVQRFQHPQRMRRQSFPVGLRLPLSRRLLVAVALGLGLVALGGLGWLLPVQFLS